MVEPMLEPQAAIVGWYCEKPEQKWDLSLQKLMHQTVIKLADSFQAKVQEEVNPDYEIHRPDVDAAFLSSGSAGYVVGRGGQRCWESLFPTRFGSIHEAHASGKGLTALHEATRTIKAGDADLIMVVGVDKRSDEQTTGDVSNKSVDPTLRLWDWHWQSTYADAFVAYMREHGFKQKELHNLITDCAFNDLYNAGMAKPDQEFRQKLRSKAYGRTSYDPLTENDFARNNLDGAVGLILVPPEKAHQYTKHPIYINDSVSLTGSTEFWNQKRTELPSLKKCKEKIFSNYSLLRDYNMNEDSVNLLSVDDKCIAITPLIIEGLGFIDKPAVKEISRTIDHYTAGEKKGEKIEYDNKFGGKFILNPGGGTYVNSYMPGVSGLYRVVNCAEYSLQNKSSKDCCSLIQEHSGNGSSQTLISLEVYK